jgi:hypothetical protein
MFGFHSFALHPHGQLRQHSRTSTADCACVLGSQMCGNISRSLGHGQELAKWFPMQLQPFWDTLERQKHQETKLTVSTLCMLKWLKKHSHAHRLPRVLEFQGMAMASFTISSSLKTIATGASCQDHSHRKPTVLPSGLLQPINEMEYHQGGLVCLISVFS